MAIDGEKIIRGARVPVITREPISLRGSQTPKELPRRRESNMSISELGDRVPGIDGRAEKRLGSERSVQAVRSVTGREKSAEELPQIRVCSASLVVLLFVDG